MALGFTKTTSFSHKPVLLGLILILLALTISCGYIQAANHSVDGEGMKCDKSWSLVNYMPTKDEGLLLSIIFFSLIALALLIKSGLRLIWNFIDPLRPSLISLKAFEPISKLYNPILQALRRGILNPQIYNLAVIR